MEWIKWYIHVGMKSASDCWEGYVYCLCSISGQNSLLYVIWRLSFSVYRGTFDVYVSVDGAEPKLVCIYVNSMLQWPHPLCMTCWCHGLMSMHTVPHNSYVTSCLWAWPDGSLIFAMCMQPVDVYLITCKVGGTGAGPMEVLPLGWSPSRYSTMTIREALESWLWCITLQGECLQILSAKYK